MDKTTFKISLDFEGKNELNDIVSKLMQKYKIDANADFTHIRATIENDVEKPMGKIQKMYNSFKTSFADFGFVYSGVTSAVKAIGDIYNATIKATVDAAAETQQLKLRLVSLYQSTEKAEQAFAKFRDLAASTLKLTSRYQVLSSKVHKSQLITHNS